MNCAGDHSALADSLRVAHSLADPTGCLVRNSLGAVLSVADLLGARDTFVRADLHAFVTDLFAAGGDSLADRSAL